MGPWQEQQAFLTDESSFQALDDLFIVPLGQHFNALRAISQLSNYFPAFIIEEMITLCVCCVRTHTYACKRTTVGAGSLLLLRGPGDHAQVRLGAKCL